MENQLLKFGKCIIDRVTKHLIRNSYKGGEK
jgi:hypothetical protein